jgi:hypothetical protein
MSVNVLTILPMFKSAVETVAGGAADYIRLVGKGYGEAISYVGKGVGERISGVHNRPV